MTAPTLNPIPNSINKVGISPNQQYAPVTPKTGIKVNHNPAALAVKCLSPIRYSQNASAYCTMLPRTAANSNPDQRGLDLLPLFLRRNKAAVHTTTRQFVARSPISPPGTERPIWPRPAHNWQQTKVNTTTSRAPEQRLPVRVDAEPAIGGTDHRQDRDQAAARVTERYFVKCLHAPISYFRISIASFAL